MKACIPLLMPNPNIVDKKSSESQIAIEVQHPSVKIITLQEMTISVHPSHRNYQQLHIEAILCH